MFSRLEKRGQALENACSMRRFFMRFSERDGMFAGIQFPIKLAGAERLVFAAREQKAAIRRDADGGHALFMAAKRPDILPGDQIPQSDGFIISAGKHESSVRRQRDGKHRTVMPFQHKEALACFDIPQAQRAIRAGGEQMAAVRRRGDGGDALLMAFQQLQHSPAGLVPQAD